MSLSPENLLFENTRMIDGPNNVPIQSAPVTPRHDPMMSNMPLPPHSISAPGTPDRRMEGGPPLIQRLTDRPPSMHQVEHSAFAPPMGKGREPQLLAPSAFQAARGPSPVGVIGSGMRANNMRDVEQQMQNVSLQNRNEGFERERGMADPRLAPGNGARRNAGADPSLAPGYPTSRGPTSQPGQMSQNQLMLQQQMLDAHRQAQLQHQQRQQLQQQQGDNSGQQQDQRRIIQEHEAHQKHQLMQRMQLQQQQQQQRMQQQNHMQHQQTNGPMKSLPTPVGK